MTAARASARSAAPSADADGLRAFHAVRRSIGDDSADGIRRHRDGIAAIIAALADGADPHMQATRGPRGTWGRPTILAMAVQRRHEGLASAVCASARFDPEREVAIGGGVTSIPGPGPDGADPRLAIMCLRAGIPVFGNVPPDTAASVQGCRPHPSAWDIAGDPPGPGDVLLRLDIVRRHADAVAAGGARRALAIASWLGRNACGYRHDDGQRSIVLRWLPVQPELMEPAMVTAAAADDTMRFLAAAGRTS